MPQAYEHLTDKWKYTYKYRSRMSSKFEYYHNLKRNDK